MLFKKPLSEVEFSDIQKLKDGKIEESLILDYKKEMISDDKLIKHITAFSNTSGGFLVFGVEESGRGGYPKDIQGIEASVNVERLEQIIISNIRPRIGVQFSNKIDVPNSDKIILIIRIPEGQNRPYYSINSHRYYRRYNFEAMPMDEYEVESLYQKRFFGASKLAKYVEEVVLSHIHRTDPYNLPERIDDHIVITPMRIDDRIIDTSNKEQIKINFDPAEMRFEPYPRRPYLSGMANPSRYGIKWNMLNNAIEVHRNGLVHFVGVYGLFDKNVDMRMIHAKELPSDLLRTIQFADKVYSIYDFMGKVKIMLRNVNIFDSKIYRRDRVDYDDYPKFDADEICIEREWDSWRLKEDYLEIGKSIMDEFSNYYELWEASMFNVDDEGNIEFSK
jgi:hypothetical protein